MKDFFDFAEKNKFALFPMPAGQKLPHGIIDSFVHDWSRDPAQWKAWHDEHKCNFGIVAGRSRLLIADVDVAEIGREAAWQHWSEWCESRGLPVFKPYCESARGGWHIAFALPEHVDDKTLRQVPLIEPIEGVSKKSIIDLRVGNGYVVSPGSHFEGRPYTLFPDATVHPAPDALFAACGRAQRKTTAARAGTADANDTAKVLEWMAENYGFASYDDWREVGMILRSEFGDDPGFSLWQITNDGTCSAEAEAAKWQSFSPDARADGVGIGTLRKRAKVAGCPHGIRTSISAMFEGVAQLAAVQSPSIQPTLPKPATANEFAEAAAEAQEAVYEKEYPTPPGGFIESSAQFVADYEPPDYVVDGILQRRFCESMTAQTGVGKTAVAMVLSAHVATGRPLGNLDVEKGTVIYFAGENPTDIQGRWLGLTMDMRIDPATTDVHFIKGAMHLSKIAKRITAEVETKGLKPSLVVVDTAAAYFEGDDENSNTQAVAHARRMRLLCKLPGGPCVLVLCHPTKNASDDNLIPRGGSAFLNEVDGNIALRRNETTIAASALGKFRGPEFPPINFELHTVRDHPRLKDTRGRPIPTVVARPISNDEKAHLETTGSKDDDAVLKLLCDRPGLNPTGIAKALDWKLRAAARPGKEPAINDNRARRTLKRLKEEKMVEERLKIWFATPKGQKHLNVVEAQ